MYGSLTGLILQQQQHKVHGMEIELVQAKNAVEQSGNGSGRLWLGYTVIGCSSRMSMYQSVLPNGRSMFPSARAPSALVPNALMLQGLSL
ncbi:hypothetical protein K492DRAFT_195062 [Lichtheimia hyalospora FSU 10163]|nr:hypothetical protein K492DRAFT_195062 [Lichtheimia hyalospora FSU 10163]